MNARHKQPGLTLVGGHGGRRGPRSPAPNSLWDVLEPGSMCAGCGEPLPSHCVNRVFFCDNCLADDDGPEAA